MALLEATGLSKHFGGVVALKNVDISVEQGSIIGLIGPNGAGKTTLFNAVAGAFKLTSGKVVFDSEDLTGLSASEICRRGIARTFQITRPFGEMSCLENVAVGLINSPRRRVGEDWREPARSELAYLGLAALSETPAKNLNVVQKKRLEIARALATSPKLIMLDEVLGGLNTQEILEAIGFIRRMRDERGLTIFWIEHVMGAIMQATDRVLVLDQGEVLMEGSPREVAADSRVIQAYLGQ